MFTKSWSNLFLPESVHKKLVELIFTWKCSQKPGRINFHLKMFIKSRSNWLSSVHKKLAATQMRGGLQVDIDSPVGGMVARETFRTGYFSQKPISLMLTKINCDGDFSGLEHFLEPWLVKGEQESRFDPRQHHNLLQHKTPGKLSGDQTALQRLVTLRGCALPMPRRWEKIHAKEKISKARKHFRWGKSTRWWPGWMRWLSS